MRPATHISFRTVVLAGCCAAFLPSGCATIANGRHQKIQVETNPPAARVSVKGTHHQTKGGPLQFETPGEVILRRREKQVTLRIEKNGYEPAEVALERKGGGWAPVGGASFLALGALGGAFAGGAVGAIVYGAIYLGISVGIDLATGSAYQLDPSKVSVTLQPKAAATDEPDSLQQQRTQP